METTAYTNYFLITDPAAASGEIPSKPGQLTRFNHIEWALADCDAEEWEAWNIPRTDWSITPRQVQLKRTIQDRIDRAWKDACDLAPCINRVSVTRSFSRSAPATGGSATICKMDVANYTPQIVPIRARITYPDELTATTFYRFLPNMIQGHDNNGESSPYRPKSEAILRRRITFNAKNCRRWIGEDMDQVFESIHAAHDTVVAAGLPEPNLIVRNPISGHVHAWWCLKNPVSFSAVSRRRPQEYFQAIRRGLRSRLIADRGFVNRVGYNPLHDDMEAMWCRSELYTMDELNAPLTDDDKKYVRMKGDPIKGAGRNVDVFTTVLHLITHKPHIQCLVEFKEAGDRRGCDEYVLDVCREYNSAFDDPMDDDEVRRIATNIMGYKWDWINPAKFHSLKEGHVDYGNAVRWKGHVATSRMSVWRASRAAAEGSVTTGKMDVTNDTPRIVGSTRSCRDLAKEVGVNFNTISRWKKTGVPAHVINGWVVNGTLDTMAVMLALKGSVTTGKMDVTNDTPQIPEMDEEEAIIQPDTMPAPEPSDRQAWLLSIDQTKPIPVTASSSFINEMHRLLDELKRAASPETPDVDAPMPIAPHLAEVLRRQDRELAWLHRNRDRYR